MCLGHTSFVLLQVIIVFVQKKEVHMSFVIFIALKLLLFSWLLFPQKRKCLCHKSYIYHTYNRKCLCHRPFLLLPNIYTCYAGIYQVYQGIYIKYIYMLCNEKRYVQKRKCLCHKSFLLLSSYYCFHGFCFHTFRGVSFF